MEWASSPEPIKSSLEWAAAKKSRLWSGRARRARAQAHGTIKTCRSRQSRTLFGNLRWGGPYLSNTENSRAVFSPSEILRGLLGAARERPPLHAPRPPSPGVWPRAAAARPLVPGCGPSGTGRAHKPGRAPSRGTITLFISAASRGGPHDHFVLFRSRLPISLHEISPSA